MSPKNIILFILVVYLAGYFSHAIFLKTTVYGDGKYYYSWLRSAVLDHDIQFTNEYTELGGGQPITTLGLPGNKYSVGPAILWAPGFIWINQIVRGTGYEFPYQMVVGLENVLYCTFALILLYRLLNRHFSQEASLASVVGIAGATNLLFYGSVDTVNSHAVLFFAAALFLTCLFQKSKNWFLIGCTLGLIALIRTQDIIFGILAIPYLPKKRIHFLFLGLLLAFIPQLVAWQFVYGKFWISPYLSDIEGFNVFQPHIFGVLFSLPNGLILWTPMVLLGFIGFWMKRNYFPLKLMATIILIQVYLVASWSIWWQGASYSGRMFVGILPLIAFGLANLFTFFQKRKFKDISFYLSILVPLCFINFILIVFFLLK